MSDRKRALESNGADGTVNKKLKSDVSTVISPNAPQSEGDYSSSERLSHVLLQPFLTQTPTGSNGAAAATPGGLSTTQLIAQKRAEINAKLAAMKNIGASVKPTLPTAPKPTPGLAAPVPKVPIIPASVPSKVVLAVTPSPTVSGAPTPAPAPATEELARRVAEAKRRVADAQSKLAVKDNPYMALAAPNKKRGSATATPVEAPQQGAGLKMAAHPLLLDQTPILAQSKKDRYKPMQPKFASIKANVRNAATPPPPLPTPTITSNASANPYSLAGKDAGGTGFEGAPRERAGRGFRFNPKGKYVAMANQMRHDQQLEDLKQRIAESARKAGLDSEMGIEKSVRRAPPPDAEWWDAALLPSNKYEDIDTVGVQGLHIRTPDSPITIYIQHPIPIPAPGDKSKATLKPLMLTTKEQKKMRKLRRKEILQDKRDRIRMGLLPPDPPKVRLANLMRVLTSDAIQDPTRVEARVRRDVAMRKHGHEKANAERKLTDEQRREKKEAKKLDEDRRGIFGAVFKVKNLSDPAHQFKVRKNADQLNLTGICILNPQFNMIYVEGAGKFMKNYKRLMLHRIAWTEAARPKGAEEVELENPDSDMEGVDEEGIGASSSKNGASTSAAGAAGDGATPVQSLEDNTCHLVWEGALRDRSFSGFKVKSCPTDRDAKEFLGEKMKGYWDMTKNWKPEEEDFF